MEDHRPSKVAQCGNSRIILSLRFYVKSIFGEFQFHVGLSSIKDFRNIQNGNF